MEAPITGIFDSHAHYDDPQFDADRDEVIAALPGAGVRFVLNAASDLETAAAGLALAESFPFFYAAAGIHPHEALSAPENWRERLAALLSRPKCRALGEIGLDYHYDADYKAAQLALFEAQLALAAELAVPVIIHDREAHGDTLELLRRYRPRGVVHCFSGSAEMAREIVRLGMYLGFTGAVTFKNARRALEAAAVVPEDRILIETDCPYLAPEPFRGRRCDSRLLPQVLKALAPVRGVTEQRLADLTRQNAMALYGIEASV